MHACVCVAVFVSVDEKLRKVKKQDLKVTHKKKLGPKFLEITKTQLKRITSKRVKRLHSDHVRLLESPQSDECEGEPPYEEVLNGEMHKKSKKQSKKKGAIDEVCSLDEIQTTESNSIPKKHKKRKLASSVSVHRNKKRSVSEDNVPLVVSDSDSSLNNKAEVLDEEEEGDINDSKSGGDEREVGGEESCEGESVEGERSVIVTSEKKNAKRKKVYKRIKVGKRWVKETDTSGGAVSDGGREGDGAAPRRKKEIDDERRKKRIEHRRLRRQRKKVFCIVMWYLSV